MNLRETVSGGRTDVSSEEARFDLACLDASLRWEEPELFLDHVRWLAAYLGARGQGPAELSARLARLGALVRKAGRDLDRRLEALRLAERVPARFVPPARQSDGWTDPLADPARDYLEALRTADAARAAAVVERAVARGVASRRLERDLFARVQHEIGRLWLRNELSIAEEHFCTAVAFDLLARLERPSTPRPGARTAVVTPAAGELHGLGARLAANALGRAGWRVLYLGADGPAETVARLAMERGADLVAVSASLTPRLGDVANLVESLRAYDPPRRTKVLVGGHPFEVAPRLASRLGADATAACATSAGEVVVGLFSA